MMSEKVHPKQPPSADVLTRRQLLQSIAVAGAAGATFGSSLLAAAEDGKPVSKKMVEQASWLSGLEFTEDEVELMLEDVGDTLKLFEQLREVRVDNSVAPALHFYAHGATDQLAAQRDNKVSFTPSAVSIRPPSDDDLAFLPLTELASLLKSRQVSSGEITELYLSRLRRYDPMLECVISYTEEIAMQQADIADREIASGNYRGPLHGIPWGAKDLLAVPDYRTTWGAKPYERQVRPEKATVVTRLQEAGAVLVAKLTLGALAWGDVWYGGKTRNPWKPEQGSSGSSAGPGSATAAGLVGFSLGTETWGSIVSPSTRNGVTGLRPTHGRVSKAGAMALSWSMDKIGPMCRSVEDCALVFGAIHGADPLDPSAVERPFRWPPERDPRTLRLGYLPELFEEDRSTEAQSDEQKARISEWQEIDRRSLETLKEIGFKLVPFELPSKYPVEALQIILSAEAAAAFDDLTRSGRDDLMARQIRNAWPNSFRTAQMIPAVEYIRANRIRSLVMQEMEEKMANVDVFVAPSFAGGHLLLTNLTGHPAVVVPNGFRASDGTPTSITFTGHLFRETDVLAVAHSFQSATEFHLKHPPLETFLTEFSQRNQGKKKGD